jgi:PKD repeat protein
VHDYAAPGNYTIDVTVTNTLGTATRTIRSLAIASTPSLVRFVTADSPDCINCVVVREDAGTLTLSVARTLDLSRTVSVDVVVNGAGVGVPTIPIVSQTLVFGPNETLKTVTIPVANDSLYYGPKYYPLGLGNPTGGLVAQENVSWHPTLLVLDDPQPVLSIDPSISVQEGDAGLTTYSIPVHLSAPMQLNASANVFIDTGTATPDDFVYPYGLTIKPGETSGAVTAAIRGDRAVEPDETFTVRLAPRFTTNDPAFGNVTAAVTIVNDDFAQIAEPIPTLDSVALLLLGVILAAVALRTVR